MTRTRTLSIALLTLGLGAPVPLLAQAEGNGKHAQAVSLQANAPSLSAVARLHVAAARERDLGDPQAQRCLSKAAHLEYYAGNLKRAQRLLVEAAEVALQRGDIEYAAHTLLMAAIVAQELQNPISARALVQRAELLALGPTLGSEQRDRILARVVRRPDAVAASR